MPACSPGLSTVEVRWATTLMHELAYSTFDYTPASVQVSPAGPVLLSDYSEEHEEEPDWLGVTLFSPQAILLHHCSAGKIRNLYRAAICGQR